MYSGNYTLNDRKVFQFAQVSLMPPFCYCFVDSFLSSGKLSKRRLRRTTFESRIREISSGYCSNIFLPKSISATWPDKDLEVEKWKTVSLLVQLLISSQLEVISGERAIWPVKLSKYRFRVYPNSKCIKKRKFVFFNFSMTTCYYWNLYLYP